MKRNTIKPQPNKKPHWPTEDFPFYQSYYNVVHFQSNLLDKAMHHKLNPLIPHIIHQIWTHSYVPRSFVPWIKSVVRAHPNWQYWFWTHQDIHCYFKTKHPEFYQSLLLKYPSFVHQSDAARYFILYDYGGFYLDVDVEVLRPLDPWTYMAESLISLETYEHSYIWRSEPNVINSVMGTKPKHGYYKMLQDNLKLFFKRYPNNLLRATGPLFIDDIYRKYSSFHSGSLTVIHPKYWFPTMSKSVLKKIRDMCQKSKNPHPDSRTLQIICDKNRKVNYTNEPGPDAFLHHHWQHSYDPSMQHVTTKNLTYIFKVLPNLVKVSDRLKLKC